MNKDTNTRSWPWYKAWIAALIHPNDDTWNLVMSEGNVSFRRAYIWLIFTSLLFPLAYSIVVWLKSSLPINSSNGLTFIRNIVLIGIFEPILFVVLTGIAHFVARLFSKTGNYSNFFVVFAASYAPISLLYAVTALVRLFVAFKIGSYAGILLVVYFVAFILTLIINFNYHVNLFIALVISIGVAVLAYYSGIAIFAMTGVGI